jgi:hypothetical protein
MRERERQKYYIILNKKKTLTHSLTHSLILGLLLHSDVPKLAYANGI